MYQFAAADGGETIDPETFEFYKGGVHPNFTMIIDGAEYSVYLKLGTASNIKINDQYYNLSGDDFATISEILYWQKQGTDPQVCPIFYLKFPPF